MSVIIPPTRSPELRLLALEQANDIRVRRGKLKREIKAGCPIVPLILEPPVWLGTMKVIDLLIALPRYGSVRVGKMLGRYFILPTKTIGALTVHQREQLVAVLRVRGIQ